MECDLTCVDGQPLKFEQWHDEIRISHPDLEMDLFVSGAEAAKLLEWLALPPV